MPSNTYKLISSVTVGAAGASSIDFASIPATFTDLKLVMSLRSTAPYTNVFITANGATTSFTWRALFGDGSAASSINDGGTTSSFNISGAMPRSTYTANTFGNTEFYIPNYAGSTNKSFSFDATAENNATATAMTLTAGLWSNTAAITSLKLVPDPTYSFVQHSTAYLYGVKSS